MARGKETRRCLMIHKEGVEPHHRMEAKRDPQAAATCRPQVAAICPPAAVTKHAPWGAAICLRSAANPPNQPEVILPRQVVVTAHLPAPSPQEATPRLRVEDMHRHHSRVAMARLLH